MYPPSTNEVASGCSHCRLWGSGPRGGFSCLTVALPLCLSYSNTICFSVTRNQTVMKSWYKSDVLARRNHCESFQLLHFKTNQNWQVEKKPNFCYLVFTLYYFYLVKMNVSIIPSPAKLIWKKTHHLYTFKKFKSELGQHRKCPAKTTP